MQFYFSSLELKSNEKQFHVAGTSPVCENEY